MTPAEESRNLTGKFMKTGMMINQAKKCALIACNEAIQALKDVREGYDHEYLECVENDLKYYELVKQEIEKL